MQKFFIATILALLSIPLQATAYKLEPIVHGIQVPWGMAQLPDGNLLVTERSGKLYFVELKTGKKFEVVGLPEISARGQGGLLDIALHPEYSKNKWLYFTYASSEGKGDGDNTALMRARLKGLKLVDLQLLYKASPNSNKTRHYGSRIAFDDMGYVYFSIGDRADRDINPQALNRDGGKIYRLHDDGRLPADNPFVSVEGAKKATYSYGHRNPQGMAFNPWRKEIWAHEHGPKGGDELNIIRKGVNYGWPVITYGRNYIGTKITDLTHKEGMAQPVIHWTPSIAPSGMTFVSSSKYPHLKGHLLVGSLKFAYVELLRLEEDKVIGQHKLFENIGRVRNIKQLSDDYIYIAVEGDAIYRVQPLK